MHIDILTSSLNINIDISLSIRILIFWQMIQEYKFYAWTNTRTHVKKNCKIGKVGHPLPMTISWTRRVAGGCVFTWTKTQYCQNPPTYHLKCNQSLRQTPKKIWLYTEWTFFIEELLAFDDFLVLNTRCTIALIFYATLNMIVMAKC